MNRLIQALLIVLSFAGVGASADTGFLDRSLGLAGQQYRYQVYVPINWSPSRKWPVIVTLPGNGSQGSDGLSQTTQSALVTEIRSHRDRFPTIVIFPQARAGARWSNPAMEEMVLAQIDQTVNEFNGDTSRVYLAGFSMGGGGVIRMASRWPERFAAVVDVSGRVSVPINATANITQPLIDEDVRTHAYLQSADPFRAVAGLIHNLPIWIFHGDADQTVPVEESRRLVAALKAVGASVRYTEYPGVDHTSAPSQAWSEKGLSEWLFAQRRSLTGK
jgi:predicted peptidase